MVSTLPASGQVQGVIYFRMTDYTMHIWNGVEFVQLNKTTVTQIPADATNDDIPTTKAVADYVQASGFKAGTHAKWQAIQVLRILKNEVYTGTMVQGRRQKINYKIKKIRDVEESGWIRVPNMHEAIIPQKLFDTVQEVLKLDTCASKGQQTVNLFSGIVRCGGCGQNMVRRTVSKNGKKYIYLHCVTNHNGLGCSSHLISESKLEEVVLAALQGKIRQISGLEHRLDEINEIPKNERRLKSVEEHLKMLEQEEQKYQTLRRQLYEDMSNGIVSQEEYNGIRCTVRLSVRPGQKGRIYS